MTRTGERLWAGGSPGVNFGAPEQQREVLRFIALGRTAELIRERFGDFDMAPLIDGGYVEIRHTEPLRETDGGLASPGGTTPYYALTPKGERAAGLA